MHAKSGRAENLALAFCHPCHGELVSIEVAAQFLYACLKSIVGHGKAPMLKQVWRKHGHVLRPVSEKFYAHDLNSFAV